MGETASLLLPYPEASDPADVPTDMRELAERLDKLGGAAGAGLPAAPTNGQVAYVIADAAAGVIWQVRYRADSPHALKWEFVGGPSLYVRDDLDSGATAGGYGTYGNAQIVLPALAMDADIDWGGSVYIGQAGNSVRLAIKIGAAAADEPSAAVMHSTTTVEYWQTMAASKRYLGVAAGATVIEQVGGNSGGHAIRRWMRITPVRVG